MSAIERAQALLRLRGAGATIESIRQMSNFYGEDSSLVPTAFVFLDKFKGAKAITAFGGYAVFKGLMTDEQVYAQRDVFGDDYESLDFTLNADNFKKHIDALEADTILANANEARRKDALGITVNESSIKVGEVVRDINVSDMAKASLVTRANLESARDHLNTLLNYQAVVVEETAKGLHTA
jgi:hypothetical protein